MSMEQRMIASFFMFVGLMFELFGASGSLTKITGIVIFGTGTVLWTIWYYRSPLALENRKVFFQVSESKAENASNTSVPESHVESWWTSYADDVLTDLANDSVERDRVFAAYDKLGFQGVAAYLREKDQDLTGEEALAIARDIISQKGRLVARTEQEEDQTVRQAGEESTANKESKKSWIDKWLQR